ncbi:MAG: class I SAM-dependent methyltransferase [Ignavibacteriae bacterium]|nr:class I SAM-dependent methyltransferase [Ignavibacteriota bacterium]
MTNFFEESYAGIPPWEIGKPQAEFIKLEREELFGKNILDVGCGTGDLAIYLTSLGYTVVGVDCAPTAIKKAQAKAIEYNVNIKFEVMNALELQSFNQQFETIIDCGLFHVFEEKLREKYRSSLESVLKPGGTYYMLVFSELETREGGPLRITQEEIRRAFQAGWNVNWIRAARFETHLHEDGSRAWLASLTFTP